MEDIEPTLGHDSVSASYDSLSEHLRPPINYSCTYIKSARPRNVNSDFARRKNPVGLRDLEDLRELEDLRSGFLTEEGKACALREFVKLDGIGEMADSDNDDWTETEESK
ncbi:hypothetical protein BLNAU_17615 [Blattamonas nauphoetae]|uniref:Uncharacterized protein n=1 Tax=Blattamonas nauphoetae TaxID=2049346 RepID=A0ABQ9X6R6_9EUKA|nr:hypothetical protein BLNAU_17615 [Blattamonas nauphoetae]